jgi:flagellar hook-associated protein 3 FlgL
MRISDATRYDTMQTNMQEAQARQFRASQEASSGLRVGAPSDDPVAAAQALRASGAAARVDTFRSTIRTVRGDVELAESTLAQAGDIVMRAQEIALQGASGNINAAERLDLAVETRQLREGLIALANQKGTQGYLFAGSKTSTEPFDPTSAAFAGDDLDRSAEIGPSLVSTVSVSGAKAFTLAGGSDVFAALDSLATALSSNNVTGVQAAVSSLDAGRRQVLAARVDAGLKVARFDVSDVAHEHTQVALSTQMQSLVSADPATSYSRFIQAGQGVDQAIAVAKRMMDTIGSAFR